MPWGLWVVEVADWIVANKVASVSCESRARPTWGSRDYLSTDPTRINDHLPFSSSGDTYEFLPKTDLSGA